MEEVTQVVNWASVQGSRTQAVTTWEAKGRTPATSAITKGIVFRNVRKFDRGIMCAPMHQISMLFCKTCIRFGKTCMLNEPCFQAFDSPKSANRERSTFGTNVAAQAVGRSP